MLKKLPSIALCLFVAAGAAQARSEPSPAAGEKGRFAAAFDVGAAFPFGSGYSTGWVVDGSFDYYVARRFAIRSSAGYARSTTDFADPFTKGSLLASAVYQLQDGPFRPYGRAGLGLYVISPPFGSTRSRVGFHVGGGMEWFFRPRTSLTGEVLVHVTQSAEDRSTSSLDLTAGIRTYF